MCVTDSRHAANGWRHFTSLQGRPAGNITQNVSYDTFIRARQKHKQQSSTIYKKYEKRRKK